MAAPLTTCDAMPAYVVEGKIGEGTFGEVFLIRHTRRRDRIFALKKNKPTKDGEGLPPTAVREVALLSALSHPNIVRLEKAHINHEEGTLSLVFDYAEYDLHDIVCHHAARDGSGVPGGPPPLFLVKSVVWQLLQGVAYLHERHVMHRDLKPSNILVMGLDTREAGRVKVADFGLARSVRAPLRPLAENGVVCTIWYRAPELLLGARHYTRAVDCWAVGAIFGECLSGRALFKGAEARVPPNPFQLDQLRKIFTALGPPTPERWPALVHLPYWHANREGIRDVQPEGGQIGFENRGGHLPPPGSAAHDLLLRLVTYDAATRISAAEALQHPFFQAAPLPSDNALVGPAGERAGNYARRAVEPLAVGAQRKRKAEEDAAALAAGVAPAPAPAPAPLAGPPGGARLAAARPLGAPRRGLPPASGYLPPPPPKGGNSSQWD